MEITPKYNMVFIILKNVKNRPGTLAEIMKNMHKAEVGVEYLHGVSMPGGKTGDIMIIIRAEDQMKALPIIEKLRTEIKGEKPTIVAGLLCITIRGISFSTSSEALDKVFTVCASKGVNIIMAYTTLIAVNIFIETKDLSVELMELLRKAFGEE